MWNNLVKQNELRGQVAEGNLPLTFEAKNIDISIACHWVYFLCFCAYLGGTFSHFLLCFSEGVPNVGQAKNWITVKRPLG